MKEKAKYILQAYQCLISYEYTSHKETNINPKRKWYFKTGSPIFLVMYSELTDTIQDFVGREIIESGSDIGGLSLIYIF